MMEFSVLMTVYAGENPEYLEHAVESVVCQQTLKPNELVLVKDGPLTEALEDKISSLVLRYPIIHVFSLPENVGQGKASAFGLEQCQYDWVARMDSDDISLPDRFQNQIDYLEMNPDLVALGGHIKEFNHHIDDSNRSRIVPVDWFEIIKFSKKRNPINNVTAIVNKCVLQSINFHSSLRFAEDYEMWIRLILSGYKIGNLDEYLVYVRVGDSIAKKRSGTAVIRGYSHISKMMYNANYINWFEYLQNIVSIYMFSLVPNRVRSMLYQVILRKKY